MKKAFLLIIFLIGVHCVYSQKSSINVDLGRRLNVDNVQKQGFGIEYQYRLLDKIRVGPSVMAYLGEDVKSLDIHLNVHYLLSINNKFTLYPLVGLAMINNNYDAIPHNISSTIWGWDIGAGLDYSVFKRSYVKLQFSYTGFFKNSDNWAEKYSLIKLGYGFRF